VEAASGLIKHNPAFLSSDEMRRAFVVREAERQILLQVIRENNGPVNQHVLIIALRGMGKTMLARRIALDVTSDGQLGGDWHPLVLSEECYDIATAGDLWVRVLGEAARAASAPNRWSDAYDRLRRERDPVRLREQALARLREFAEEAGKRLLVVVENLNLVFTEQASDDTGWEVRDTLLNDPTIMLLATATSRFDEIDRPGRALYDLFRVVRLEPLNTADCQALWKAVNGEVLTSERIRPLEILTGGNPRLLAILAEFSAGRSFREITQSFAALIDEYTTYFKANIESLPAQERRVFVTLADIWDPAEARRVAALARLGVNKTSAYLKRLVDRGAVTAERTGRKAFYQVAERLLNLYYLMRQSSAASERARAVVEFMVRFYGTEQTVRRITAEAVELPAPEREYHNVAIRYLFSRSEGEVTARDRLLAAFDKRYWALPEAAALLVAEPTAEGQRPSEAATDTCGAAEEGLAAALELLKSERPTEALGQLDHLIADLGCPEEAPVAGHLACAFLARGVTLERLGGLEEAVASYDEAVALLGEHEEVLWAAVSTSLALFSKGVLLGDLGRSEEAIAVYDEVVERFGEREEITLSEQVARALSNKGFRLKKLGRYEEELAVYDEVVRRFGERKEIPLAAHVAWALVDKGLGLGELGRSEEAIAVSDEVLERVGERDEDHLDEQVGWALVHKGFLAAKLGRLRESVDCIVAALPRQSVLEKHQERLVSLLIGLAGEGLDGEILEAIESSPAAKRLEPLIAALRIHRGEQVRGPEEVMKVAGDIAKRIAEISVERRGTEGSSAPAVDDK